MLGIPIEAHPDGGDYFPVFTIRNAHSGVLRVKCVTVEGEVLVWERGKHAWIRDLDGNQVELYEEMAVERETRRCGATGAS